MKYRVTYHADRWHPHRPSAAGEWQVVRNDLGDGRRLYVELARTTRGIQVIDARLEVRITDRYGRAKYHTERLLRERELELVEAAAQAPDEGG